MNSSSTPDVVRSEDPNAAQHLQTKIAAAEKLQATMKAANMIVRDRRLSDDEKVARLVAECGQRESSARQLLKPDFGGRIGFPDYQLTNNGANIRRMQQRLKGLAHESGRGSVTLPFAGGRVEDNAEECRVRIYHDAKPPADTIAKLRSHGFHWTPSLRCWQRLRNDWARSAATQITGVQWPLAAPAATAGPSVATVKTVAPGQGPRTGGGRLTATSQEALGTLRRMARGHAGASSGEFAAWEILGNLREGTPVDFAGNFVRLDSGGKRAVVQLLLDLTTGGTGLCELD